MEELVQLLESEILGNFKAYLQGSLTEGEEPQSFFTFWDFNNNDSAKYDNRAHANETGFWIYFYTTDMSIMNSTMLALHDLLIANDYDVDGIGKSLQAFRPEYSCKVITAYKTINY